MCGSRFVLVVHVLLALDYPETLLKNANSQALLKSCQIRILGSVTQALLWQILQVSFIHTKVWEPLMEFLYAVYYVWSCYQHKAVLKIAGDTGVSIVSSVG